MKNDEVEVSWEYPDSWSTPHSYFSLKFFVQIQCNKEKTKKKKKKAEEDIERKCKQVGFTQPMLQIPATRTRTVPGAFCMYCSQPTQKPKGSQYFCHPFTEKDSEAQRCYDLSKFT